MVLFSSRSKLNVLIQILRKVWPMKNYLLHHHDQDLHVEYEEIDKFKETRGNPVRIEQPHPPKGDYEYSQCPAYASTQFPLLHNISRPGWCCKCNLNMHAFILSEFPSWQWQTLKLVCSITFWRCVYRADCAGLQWTTCMKGSRLLKFQCWLSVGAEVKNSVLVVSICIPTWCRFQLHEDWFMILNLYKHKSLYNQAIVWYTKDNLLLFTCD